LVRNFGIGIAIAVAIAIGGFLSSTDAIPTPRTPFLKNHSGPAEPFGVARQSSWALESWSVSAAGPEPVNNSCAIQYECRSVVDPQERQHPRQERTEHQAVVR
jgi:hypothetical protein